MPCGALARRVLLLPAQDCSQQVPGSLPVCAPGAGARLTPVPAQQNGLHIAVGACRIMTNRRMLPRAWGGVVMFVAEPPGVPSRL